jgi:hypothetical protein
MLKIKTKNNGKCNKIKLRYQPEENRAGQGRAGPRLSVTKVPGVYEGIDDGKGLENGVVAEEILVLAAQEQPLRPFTLTVR